MGFDDMAAHKTLAFLVVIAPIAAAAYFYVASNQASETLQNSITTTEPTDFAKVGTITVNSPGNKQGTMYLVYEEPSAPAITKELMLDPLSFCTTSNGSAPCIAMSVSFDVPFHGKRAIVEGNAIGTTTVLVRKLYVPPEGLEPLAIDPGSVFMSWPNAQTLLKSCDARMVMQTHALDVYVTRKNGSRVRTVEPTIDEVFRVLDEARIQCGAIPVATE